MMFKKLRNKLVLINFTVTTLVIVVVFATIYIVFTNSAARRPLNMPGAPLDEVRTSEEMTDNDGDGVPDGWEKVVSFTVREEKKNAANDLLIALIVSGVAIELVVIMISFFLAEEAIKPVKTAYESQKLFIANASHEIKTPLAAISANLEAADIKNNKWIKNVELETGKLVNLNAELLTLARTDLVNNVEASLTDLRALTLKVLDSFESRLKEKKLTMRISLNKRVKINAADFEQILSILMDNAIKYSDKAISVKLDEGTLSVANDGVKIPAEKVPHLFDRFYQVDKNSEGVGLGLSIAKSLAERNHFKISVKSGKMTVFTLDF
ncbi:MAG: HAMP domain-containing sensor histidine kinase [Candidatus Saccharibacteria bacterium]|nr:HAMP domain-containing sensor histidine kinase [Candidatus Saccharibacteria bacterium]